MRTLFQLVVTLLVTTGPFLQGVEPVKSSEPVIGLNSPYLYHSVNVLTGEYVESEVDLVIGGPFPVTIRRAFEAHPRAKELDAPEWHFNHPHIFGKGGFQNGQATGLDPQIHYDYDNNERLSSIIVKDPTGKKTYGFAHFNYEKGSSCQITTHEGQKLRYDLALAPGQKGGRQVLKRVLSSKEPECQYSYTSHPLLAEYLISERILPGGRYLINEYYTLEDVKGNQDPFKDFSIGKIKAQYAPANPDGSRVRIYRFEYAPQKTTVYDSANNKTIYHYDSTQSITAIETYFGQELLYRRERFFWTGDGLSLLLAKTVENAKGEVLKAETFIHNSQKQMISHTLWGNLTGKGPSTFKIDAQGKPTSAQVEKYSTFYRYSSEGHMIECIGENGVGTRFQYDPKTKKMSAKFTVEKDAIRIRQFYFYDTDGLLTKLIVDDGKSLDAEDLRGVTERHVTLHTNAEFRPIVIEEKCLDLHTKKLITLRTLNNLYAPDGSLVRQDFYDAQGQWIGHSEYGYDERGRRIWQQDPEGRCTSQSYDVVGNVIEKSIYTPLSTTDYHYTYDLLNRLIKTEFVDAQGTPYVTTKGYNSLGQKTSNTDSYGNTTFYTYDPIGRILHIEYPEVLDENDRPYVPSESFEYDLFGNITKKVDGNGEILATTYNLLGQPTHISHPDGTEESFTYNLHGSLFSIITKRGAKIVYERDYLDRVTRATTYSSTGQEVNRTSFTYNASNITTMTDGEAVTTCYTYDPAGRPASSRKGDQYSKYLYDVRGQLVQTKSWHGIHESAYTLIDHTYDQEEEEEEEGDVLSTLHSSSEVNSRGQLVKKSESTNSQGITSSLLFDALGRPEQLLKTNPLGVVIFEQHFRHDANGNKVREDNFIYSHQGEGAKVTTSWRYGPSKRLETLIEAANTSDQRSIEYTYNEQGLLQDIIKADGVHLHHHYDCEGRLIHFYASDGSFDYSYSYNRNHQITEVTDLVHNQTTARQYDCHGLLLEERLGNGLLFQNRYDRLGRRLELTLPDSSGIVYEYCEQQLSRILRYTSRKKQLYCHEYQEYDEKGRLKQAKMPWNLGAINYTYGERGQLVAITSPYWSESLQSEERDTAERLLKVEIKDSHGDKTYHFAYDDLGQLTEEEGEQYLYDSMGNRLNHNEVPIKVNPINQLLQEGATEFGYDPNGNLISKKNSESTFLYEYDALDRLVKVTSREGDELHHLVSYTYDAFDRRLTKTYFQNPSTSETIKFLYDGDNEIGEMERGEIKTLRVLGRGQGAEVGAAVAIEIGSRHYAPIHDHRGSVSCLIDSVTREVVETYRYSAFGVRQSNGEETTVDNPWQFSSKRLDPETGWLYFGKRYLDPETGRWVTPDPLGFLDGPHRYAFLKNNPLLKTDPYGLFGLEQMWSNFTDGASQLYMMAERFMFMMRHRYSLINVYREEIQSTSDYVMGPAFLFMSGLYADRTEAGIFGSGEFNSSIRVTYINGIMNARCYYIDTLHTLSKTHGGVNIHYVFKATNGWCWDLIQCAMVRHGWTTTQAHLLAKTWKRLIQEMGGVEGGGTILHYAHSIGAADTINAGKLLSPEERRMIRVVSFGAASMVNPSHGFQSAMNYVSSCDGVPMIGDPIGYLRGMLFPHTNIVYIASLDWFPIFDHPLYRRNYATILEQLGQQFQQDYPPPPSQTQFPH